MIRAQKEAAKQKERESSFDSSNSEHDSSSDEGDGDEKNGNKHSGSEDEDNNTGEPAKKKRRGWMTDLGGVAANADGEEEKIISNIDSLPERTGEYVSSRVEPQRDLLGNRVEKIDQLDESDISEVRDQGFAHNLLATIHTAKF